MGKWDELKGRYERAPMRLDVSFIERVASERANHANKDLSALTHIFMNCYNEKDAHEEEIKRLNVELEALSQLLIARLEAQDLRSIKTDEGSYTIKIEPYASVHDRGLLEAHVDAHSELHYLYSIPPASLSAFVKGLLAQGRDAEVPQGVTVFLKSNIQFRRNKE